MPRAAQTVALTAALLIAGLAGCAGTHYIVTRVNLNGAYCDCDVAHVAEGCKVIILACDKSCDKAGVDTWARSGGEDEVVRTCQKILGRTRI